MKILHEIYVTLIDWIKDLRETRKSLVFLATGLFMWAVVHGVETPVLLTIAGLLTIVYTFFFASSHSKATKQHEKYIMENTKREPDKG